MGGIDDVRALRLTGEQALCDAASRHVHTLTNEQGAALPAAAWSRFPRADGMRLQLHRCPPEQQQQLLQDSLAAAPSRLQRLAVEGEVVQAKPPCTTFDLSSICGSVPQLQLLRISPWDPHGHLCCLENLASLAALRRLQRLELPGCCVLIPGDGEADDLAAGFAGLEELQVLDAPNMHCSSRAWQQLAAAARQLQRACFRALALGDAVPSPVRVLQIKGELSLERAPVGCLARLMPQLQELEATAPADPQGSFVPAFRQHPELQSVDLLIYTPDDINGPQAFSLQLASCPKLRSAKVKLYTGANVYTADALLADLGACPALLELEVSTGSARDGCGDYHFVTPQGLEPLARSASLRSIKLGERANDHLSLAQLALLVSPASGLESLEAYVMLPSYSQELRKAFSQLWASYCEQRAKGSDRVVYGARGEWGAMAAPAEAEVRGQVISVLRQQLGLGEGQDELQVDSVVLEPYQWRLPAWVDIQVVACARGCQLLLHTTKHFEWDRRVGPA
jgi:hypothetical protein